MALIGTDRKHRKTEKNDQEYVHKRTRDGTRILFCVLPSFVLTDNKCILSCAIIWSKQPIERKQRRAENETVRGIYISQFLFRFFKIMQSKQRQIWSYYHLSSEDQNKKNAQLDWQQTDNADTEVAAG